MPQLYSSKNGTFLRVVEKSEKELNKFICEKWKHLFPQYLFIKSEFLLNGNVRAAGNGGRIDILAYNPVTHRFVIFELKKDYDRNITDQAADYRDFVQDNFAEIYLEATQDYKVELPVYSEIQKDKVEVVLVAKRFSSTQQERARKLNKKECIVTLIRYFWFEEGLILMDYLNNDPEEKKIEEANARKLAAIKNIVLQDGPMAEISGYFGLYKSSERLFHLFYNHLKQRVEMPEIVAQNSKLKVSLPHSGETFSIVKHAGKSGRKTILQINTNLNVSSLFNLQVDDRIRPGEKKKGSLGVERFEVFLRDEKDMLEFMDFVEAEIRKKISG